MKKQPLISFCISTYQRPKFLKATIQAILKQKSNDFEIIISEDPSENNSDTTIRKFRSTKIVYLKNQKHLGMTKSYNKTIALAKGKFITLLADDDPPTRNMLEIFIQTHRKYPKAKAFFGASFVNITTQKIEKVVHLKRGITSLVNKKMPYGSTKVLPPQLFFKMFFEQEIFPHYQWTAAVIARELVKKIKGVPDYNSAHFIDYAYLLKIARLTDFVIINKELAVFALHELSYGKRLDTLDEYKRGAIGFDKIISKLAQQLNCTKEYKHFLSNYIIMFLLNRFEHYKMHGYKINTKILLDVYDDLAKKLPFLEKRRTEIYLKLTYPYLYNLANISRAEYGKIKSKLWKNL